MTVAGDYLAAVGGRKRPGGPCRDQMGQPVVRGPVRGGGMDCSGLAATQSRYQVIALQT
jgi:hypothetical protein